MNITDDERRIARLWIKDFADGRVLFDSHDSDRAVDIIRRLIEEAGKEPRPEEAFVRHIEGHLSRGQLPICTICGKNILEIYHDLRAALDAGEEGK